MQKIVVIGNGISGITAARHIRKRSQDQIVVISKESDHFFSRTALMYIYMGHMRYEDTKPYEDWFWSKNRIELVRGEVATIDFDHQRLTCNPVGSDTKGPDAEINYDQLIIATGSQPNKFGWKGQDLNHVQGLYSLQDLQNLEAISPEIEHGVIVGGGLIGIELAEMLHSRNKEVTMIVREQNYWDNVLPPEEAKMVNHQIQINGINLHLETQLDEIIGDSLDRVQAVRTNTGREIPCQFVGLTAGVHPNIGWMGKDSPLETDRGVLVDEYLQTNIPRVYAIGDCAQLRTPPENRQPIEPIWYTGRIMGETVAHTITGNPTVYAPGPWFNSAKFFDLEYQVYGLVPNRIHEPYESFYWQHPSEELALRMVYHAKNRQLVGINALGIRLKMETCMDWLRRKTTVDEAIRDIRTAHFDAEFSLRHYADIQKKFSQTKTAIV